MKSKPIVCIMVFFVFMVSLTFSGAAQKLPSDVLKQLNAYNVNWNSTSTTGSMASMPLGNGDMTANVWVKGKGDLMMYIGKSDTWSEGTRLLKVGRLRINISPNPFVAGHSFDQTLNLYKGEIEISAGQKGSKVNLKVWIDANQSILRVEASGDHKFSMKCTTELLRPHPFTLSSNNHPLAQSFRGVIEGNVKPSESADVLVPKTDAVVWYHRNTQSMYKTIIDHHNLSGLEKEFPDPYLNRTFGALMKGEGFDRMNDSTLLTSSKGKRFTLEVYPYTAQTNTVTDWENQLSGMVTQINSHSLKSEYKKH
jgi:alpha-L-fucosidase 2